MTAYGCTISLKAEVLPELKLTGHKYKKKKKKKKKKDLSLLDLGILWLNVQHNIGCTSAPIERDSRSVNHALTLCAASLSQSFPSQHITQ
jgi:hypothetical protein